MRKDDAAAQYFLHDHVSHHTGPRPPFQNTEFVQIFGVLFEWRICQSAPAWAERTHVRTGSPLRADTPSSMRDWTAGFQNPSRLQNISQARRNQPVEVQMRRARIIRGTVDLPSVIHAPPQTVTAAYVGCRLSSALRNRRTGAVSHSTWRLRFSPSRHQLQKCSGIVGQQIVASLTQSRTGAVHPISLSLKRPVCRFSARSARPSENSAREISSINPCGYLMRPA